MRLVDKRKVRCDRSDVFSTLAEGLKGKRAKEWGLIDDTFPTSKFEEGIDVRVAQIVNLRSDDRAELESSRFANDISFPSPVWERGQGRGFDAPKPSPFIPLPEGGDKSGIKLNSLEVEATDDTRNYRYVELKLHRDKRYADRTMRGPEADLPSTPDEIQKLGDSYWPLRVFRELDDALLHLRVNESEIGLVCVRTERNIDKVLAADKTLTANREHWLIRETLLYMARVLRRLDLTAKSFFAIVEPGSCFAGSLFELALSSDRVYMLNHPDEKVEIAMSELNSGAFPMSNGLTRLQSRFLSEPKQVDEVLARES